MKTIEVKVVNPYDGLVEFKKTALQEEISKHLRKDIILNSVRQKGISTLIAYSLLEDLITTGVSAFFITPHHKLMRHTFEILHKMFDSLPKLVRDDFIVTKFKIQDKHNSKNFIRCYSETTIDKTDNFRGMMLYPNTRIITEHLEFAHRPDKFVKLLERVIETISPATPDRPTLQFFDSGEGIFPNDAMHLNAIYKLRKFDFINVNNFGVTVTTADEFDTILEVLEQGYERQIKYNGWNSVLLPVWYKIFNII